MKFPAHIAVVTNVNFSGEKGGAEVFYDRLVKSIKESGQKVTRFDINCDESSYEKVLSSYLKCYDLDVSKFDGVISTKAPTFMVRHRNHVCYLVHTIRVFYDMFSEISSDKENYNRQKIIQHIDTLALKQSSTKKVFTIGKEVSRRLERWNSIESEVLYPGISSDGFYCGSYDFIFLPGRLHRWKRVDLLIEAMKYIKSPVELKIAGVGDDLNKLKELAGDDARINFLGYISDNELKKLYSNALVVPFVPIREDYGYIAHEAFMSKKPVITCRDSGEPAQFVVNNESGFVINPNPKDIAEKIDWLFNNKESAKKMGEKGFAIASKNTWNNVAEKLLNVLGVKL